MCENCNNTGLVYERREGSDYPHTCKECEKYDPFELGSDIYRMARNNPNVPVVRHY